METVYVLGGIDRHQHPLGIHLRWQWKLNQNTVNFVAPIQVIDQFEQFLGFNGVWGSMFFAVDAQLLATLYLSPDIDLGSGMVAHQHDRQTGLHPGCGHCFDIRRDFRPDLACDFVAVQNGGSHDASFLCREPNRKILP